MRIWIVGHLRALAAWIEQAPPSDVLTLTVLKDALFDRAVALVDAADARLAVGFGAAKRRDVYAQLKKDFPDRLHRDLGLVIEAVLHGA